MQGNHRAVRAACAAVGGLLFAATASAAPIFAPTDQVVGGRIDGANFVEGAFGSDGGANVYTDNFWPGNPATPLTNEAPFHLVDGVGQKYLNFAELNTGAIITPAAPSVATSLTVWTANDAEGRDPATYELYGTNTAITPGAGPYALTMFTLISSGSLSLPASRNAGGAAPLLDANSSTVSFANSTPYSSYLLVFPTVKNEPAVNSMQVAEVQLNVPEPASLTALGVAGLGLLRRRRQA